MYFCTWFGQMRPKPEDKGRGWEQIPGKWLFRAKRPMGTFYLKNLVPPGGRNTVITRQLKGIYNADTNGCVEVTIPGHIKTFVGLGYPIWGEVTRFLLPDFVLTECRREGLIWPDTPEYDRRILEAISKVGGKV